MTRNLFFAGAIAALAGACASTPRPVYYEHAPAAPVYSVFSSAPRAPLHSVLVACNGGGGSNIGPIGVRGEALLFTPYIYTPAGPLLRNPTQMSCLSSGFGWRSSLGGAGREHTGLDLANPDGGWVFAAADARVVAAEWRSGYGLTVELDHGYGVRTLYAHLREVDPNLYSGAPVQAGSAIALMGATGNATGVHLHYEVIVDGLKVDPLAYGASPPIS